MNITLNINISLFNSSNKTDGKKNKKKNKKHHMNKMQEHSPLVTEERNIPNKTENGKRIGVIMKTIALF